MISLRSLNKKISIAAPINTIINSCYFTTHNTSINPPPSAASYDDLINAAACKGDFSAVRRLLSDGRLVTANTFKFIATNISVLDDLLHNLADLDPPFARTHAHDALVAQLARLRRTDDALRVAEAMARNNHGASAITFCPIISALAKNRRDMPAAWRVLEAMRACGVPPNVTAFNCILSAHCRAGDVAAAANVVEKMEAEGVECDAATYDALVLGACRTGKVEGALAVLRRMVEEGIPALFSTYTHIIKGIMDCGHYMPALEFVRIFAGNNKKLDGHLFRYLAKR